jgi:hypothetical protein
MSYLLLAIVVVLGAPPKAAGGPQAGVVQGIIELKGKVEGPPSKHLGFLDPVENPIVEPRPYDPLPEMVVFLDGGPAAPDAGTPPTHAVVWQLLSHSFSPPLKAVVAGSQVSISNMSKTETHTLYADGGNDALVSKDDLRAETTMKSFAVGRDTVVRVLSRKLPHLEGRVVTFPTRYFSAVERNGRFKIENVPPGRWTIKVWYRDGWVGQGRPVDVPSKDDPRITLTAADFASKPEGGK